MSSYKPFRIVRVVCACNTHTHTSPHYLSYNPLGPATAPINVTATTLSARAIAVSWIEIPPIDQNGIIVAHEVLYIPEKNFSGMLTWKTINITDNAVGVLENLVPFINYTISVRAFTEAGAGVWSDPVTAATKQDSK